MRLALAAALTSVAALSASLPATPQDASEFAYHGDAALLGNGDCRLFFAGQIDHDVGALGPEDRACVLGGVIGPVWADALDGQIVLWRRGHAHVGRGTPLVVLGELGGAGAGHTFEELDRVETTGLALPDLTGDGLPEIALAESLFYGDTPVDEENPAAFATVSARDVARGEVVWEADDDAVDRSGWLVGPVRLPDLDDDGLPDLLVTTGRRGSPELTFVALSARDGTRLSEWELAWPPVAQLGSLRLPKLFPVEVRSDADGLAVVGVVFGLDTRRLLRVELDMAGTRHEVIRELSAGELGLPNVNAVASVGDHDGDGRADLALAAVPVFRSVPEFPASARERLGNAELSARIERGAVVVVGSRDGRELRAVHGVGAGGGGLSPLLTYTDVTGDGLPELLVAEGPFSRQFESVSLSLLDPATGERLGAWPRASAADATTGRPLLLYLAGPLGVLPDRDGDGLPEVLVSRARGEAHMRSQSVGVCLSSGVLCISSRAFSTPRSPDRDPGSERDG